MNDYSAAVLFWRGLQDDVRQHFRNIHHCARNGTTLDLNLDAEFFGGFLERAKRYASSAGPLLPEIDVEGLQRGYGNMIAFYTQCKESGSPAERQEP